MLNKSCCVKGIVSSLFIMNSAKNAHLLLPLTGIPCALSTSVFFLEHFMHRKTGLASVLSYPAVFTNLHKCETTPHSSHLPSFTCQTSIASEVKMNLSTQKNMAPPIKFAIIVEYRLVPIFLTTSQSMGVLSCHRIRYKMNLFIYYVYSNMIMR